MRTRREETNLKISYPVRRGSLSKISKIKPKYQRRILKRPGSFQSHEKFLTLKVIKIAKNKCKKSTNQQVLKNGQKNCWKKPGMIFPPMIIIFPMTVLQGWPGVGGYQRPDRLGWRHARPVDSDRGSPQLQSAVWVSIQGDAETDHDNDIMMMIMIMMITIYRSNFDEMNWWNW